MKKYVLLASSLAAIVGLVGLSSCGGDDDPAPHPKVSFERSSQAFDEGAGIVEVTVILDQAAGEDVKVDYDVDGTALEGAASTSGSDYEITSGSGDVTIKKGQTSAVIELKIKDDAIYEGDETIIFEISNVSSSNVDISEDNTITITISENDSQPIASFTTSKLSFNEDDFEADVEVTLDQAAPQDITLTYSIDNQDQWIDDRSIALSEEYGTTQDYPSNYFDFFIDVEDDGGVSGEIVIPQGSTTATIKVRLYTDFFFESDETISLTLTGAKNNAAAIATATAKKTAEITVEQQNGKSLQLYWGSVSADLNIYLFAGTDEENLYDMDNNYFLGVSAYQQKSTDPANYASEDVFIPTGFSDILPELNTWGASYNYRSGTVSNLPFEVDYVDYADGTFDWDNADIFEATYTLDNIHDPTVTDAEPPAIVQTFTFSDGVVSNYSNIAVPETGSRVKSASNPIVANRNIKTSVLSVNGRDLDRIAGMSGSRKVSVMRSSKTLNLLRK